MAIKEHNVKSETRFSWLICEPPDILCCLSLSLSLLRIQGLISGENVLRKKNNRPN